MLGFVPQPQPTFLNPYAATHEDCALRAKVTLPIAAVAFYSGKDQILILDETLIFSYFKELFYKLRAETSLIVLCFFNPGLISAIPQQQHDQFLLLAAQV